MTARRTLAVLALTVVAACSSPTSTTTTFDGAPTSGCMQHQHARPGSADAGSNQDVAERLSLLRYYTANGNLPYCDSKAATPTDVAWMKLYVAQGADPARVSRWVPDPTNP